MSHEDLRRALTDIEERLDYGLAEQEHVERLVLEAKDLGDAELLWRARLLLAELTGSRGELGAAMRMLGQVHDYAAAHGPASLLARCHLIMAWTYRDVGDLTSYLEHAVKAVETLEEDAPAGVRALHLIRLADALDECGSPEEARARYEQAEEVAVNGGDVTRHVSCLNNRAYGEYLAGDMEAAGRTIDRLLDLCRANDLPPRSNTLDTIARIQIAQGRHAEAVATIRRAVEVYEALDVQEAMSPAEFLLTQVLAEREGGDLESAQRSLDECRALADRAGLASILVRVEEEQAELYAARGDFEAAFHRFKAFRTAENALISERRANQAMLRQAVLETNEVRAEAERLQRLDTYRTRMIATISHELKNPLTAITGHLEMVGSVPDLPPPVLRSVAAMHRGAERLWALTDGLLELIRLQQSDLPASTTRVDLHAVVAEAVELLEMAAAEDGVTIRFVRPDDGFVVRGDADELLRAVLNLISNAVKYSRSGDVVSVELRRDGDQVVFVCSDTGLGISEPDQRLLFTEFFRSTNSEALDRPGTGLGLAIVRQVAERHGGEIEVDSELGRGSTFRLRLPASGDPATRGRAA